MVENEPKSIKNRKSQVTVVLKAHDTFCRMGLATKSQFLRFLTQKNGFQTEFFQSFHFQDPELAIVHDYADNFAFLFGLLYAWSQAILTWSLVPRMCTLRVCVLRFAICLVETVAFIFCKFPGYCTSQSTQTPRVQ